MNDQKIPNHPALLHLRRLRFILPVLMMLAGNMIIAQNLIKAEYAFDTDPGQGNGIPISLTPTANFTNLTLQINIDTLPEGFHNLFLRVKDDSGSWSMTRQLPFYKLVPATPVYNLTGLEYFFNTDPGTGHGTQIALGPTNTLDTTGISISLATLADGYHVIYMRSRDDAQRWSPPVARQFYKLTYTPSQQLISRLEYFFDADPGFGNGTQVSVTPAMTLDPFPFSIDVSGLSEGFHSLYVRSVNTAGKWSVTQSRTFYKLTVNPGQANVEALEYFFDNDPGPGQGTPLSVTPAANLDSLAYMIDIGSLSDGFHALYVRARDVHGKWSQAGVRNFVKITQQAGTAPLVRTEYFIDNDPGNGQGIAVSIAPATDLSLSFSIDLSAYADGFHTLCVRSMDSLGRWGQTVVRPFYKASVPAGLQDLVRAEYFFDNDPGTGMATPVALPPDSSVQHYAISINIDSLAEGFHTFFHRTMDRNGKWSLTSTRPFYKRQFLAVPPDLVEAEYYYDQDPGFGNGIPVSSNPAANIPFKAWQLDLSGLSFGEHQLFVRAKDENGRWSQVMQDTIFYYIDTLPTASLSGQVGACVGDTVDFLVHLTGTAPWTIVVNTGISLDTISGIMQSPWTFGVSPAQAGTYTAKVLQVSDIYYTGLYTGIAVQYQIYPLPDPAGPISGNADLCANSAVGSYSIHFVPNAESYIWTVPAGATIIQSGSHWYYGPWITVDFHGMVQSGQVSVSPVNACGSGAPSSLEVRVHANPVVEAGADQFIDFGDTAFLSGAASGGAPPYTYSWSPWWAFDNPALQGPQAYFNSTSTATLTVTDTLGCQGSDEVIVYVGPQAATVVTGTVVYDNTAGTLLSGAQVQLAGDTLLRHDITDTQGAFRFTEVNTGSYTLTAGSTRPWGGVNAGDALLILRHFVDSLSLTGLRVAAADVNASQYVNATDALLCARRFAGIDSTFPAGDWLFGQEAFYTPGVGNLSFQIPGICFGDVDGSFNPGKHSMPLVTLETAGELLPEVSGRADIPLQSLEPLEVGAISLVLGIPAGYRVESVSIPGGGPNQPIYHIRGDELRIAWYSLTPLRLEPGEALLLIHATYAMLPHGEWTVRMESSLSDAEGTSIPGARLTMPRIRESVPAFGLGTNFPNPFRQETRITYLLPAESEVSLSVLNLLGEEVLLLDEGTRPAGEHSILLDAGRLAPGVYMYRLVARSAGHQYERTRQMVRGI